MGSHPSINSSGHSCVLFCGVGCVSAVDRRAPPARRFPCGRLFGGGGVPLENEPATGWQDISLARWGNPRYGARCTRARLGSSALRPALAQGLGALAKRRKRLAWSFQRYLGKNEIGIRPRDRPSRGPRHLLPPPARLVSRPKILPASGPPPWRL